MTRFWILCVRRHEQVELEIHAGITSLAAVVALVFVLGDLHLQEEVCGIVADSSEVLTMEEQIIQSVVPACCVARA